MPAQARPNILLIHADQHRYDCLGVNGHPILQTPHLDRLAGEGVNFRHAFTPIAVCVPARCSLLTGVWPTRHGVTFNSDAETPTRLDPNIATFSRELKRAGFWLGVVGKWQADGDRTPQDVHFDRWVKDHAYHVWRQVQGLPPRPWEAGWRGEVDGHITAEQSRLAWGANELIALLGARAKADKPFFLRWDPSEPHLPNVVPEPYASMYPPGSVPPWPGFDDDLAGKPYIQAQQRRTWEFENWTWDDWAPLVARYLGEVSLLDAQVGRVLEALEGLGLADNTLVIYSADHGDLCGSHGMVDKHFVLYDDVIRVPLLMRWPGRLPAGSVCEAFVSSALDLAYTFCEAAGTPPPATFQGRSLLSAADGSDEAPREDIFATYHGNQFGLYSQRMVRNRRWKYVWNATAEDELYDLQADPGEIHNLAADGRHAEALAGLRRRLVEWMDQVQDPLLNGWIRPQILEGRKR